MGCQRVMIAALESISGNPSDCTEIPTSDWVDVNRPAIPP